MRQVLFIAIGLVVGIAGTVLFLDSAPPEPDSMEERAMKAEMELTRARKEIAGYEAVMGKRPTGFLRDTFSDRTRQIAEDIKAGKPVTVDDVFDATKPMMRTLAPLFERIRLRDQKEFFDTMAGEYSRLYELDANQQEALAEFLALKAEENAAEYFEVMTSDSSRFIDFVRAGENFERDDDIDAFMERTLEGEKLEEFKTNRLEEKLGRVQNEADRNVQRLDSIVGLDENQKDQMFVFMARSSRDFDPTMQFEGLAGDSSRLEPGQDRNEAIRSILRPDQMAAYEEHRRARREEAEEDLRDIGLTLPDDWDVFDEWDN